MRYGTQPATETVSTLAGDETSRHGVAFRKPYNPSLSNSADRPNKAIETDAKRTRGSSPRRSARQRRHEMRSGRIVCRELTRPVELTGGSRCGVQALAQVALRAFIAFSVVFFAQSAGAAGNDSLLVSNGRFVLSASNSGSGRFEEPEFNGELLAAAPPDANAENDPRQYDESAEMERTKKALDALNAIDQFAQQHLRKGMTRKQVKEVMRRPNFREKLADRVELWNYGHSHSGTVSYVVAFLDGKVEFYGQANPQWWADSNCDDHDFEGGQRLLQVLCRRRATSAPNE